MSNVNLFRDHLLAFPCWRFTVCAGQVVCGILTKNDRLKYLTHETAQSLLGLAFAAPALSCRIAALKILVCIRVVLVSLRVTHARTQVHKRAQSYALAYVQTNQLYSPVHAAPSAKYFLCRPKLSPCSISASESSQSTVNRSVVRARATVKVVQHILSASMM